MSYNLNHVKMVNFQPTGTVRRLMADKILALIVLAVRLSVTLQRTAKMPAYTREKIYGLWC